MSLSYLTEAFKSLEILEEGDFNLANKEDIEKLQDFENDQPEDVIEIMSMDFDDVEEAEEENEESHIGDVILDCPVCHSKLYKHSDEVAIDEEEQLANVGEECPYCYTADGFKIVGQVAPYQPEDEVTVDVEDKEEIEDSDDDVGEEEKEDVEVEESLNESKEVDLTEYQKWVDYDMKKYHKISKNTMDKINSAGLSVVKDQYGDYEVIAKRADNDVNESLTKSLTENVITNKLPPSISNFLENVAQTTGVIDYNDIINYGNSSKQNLNEIRKLIRKISSNLRNYSGDLYELMNEDEEIANCVKKLAQLVKSSVNESLTKSLTEKQWKYTLKSGSNLRGAIEDGDLEQVQSALVDCYDELNNHGLIDDEDYNEYIEDLQMIDLEDDDAEDSLDGELSQFYDLCDNLDIWVALNEALKEDLEKVELETENQRITIKSEKKEEQSGEQMITPLEPQVKSEIEANAEVEQETPDSEIDFDVTDFDEDSFDEVAESYLRKVYENVNSYRTTDVISPPANQNQLIIEGLIKFNSGKQKSTSFVFESKDATKNGLLRFIGENKQISRGKKSFVLKGNLNEGKFLSESLNYNYRTKDAEGNSTRIYGTAKRS